jgi:cytochrome c-type biogenesis protein CcmH/NrfF
VDLTASLLGAELLTWAIPLALLIAILIWWIVVLHRRSDEDA